MSEEKLGKEKGKILHKKTQIVIGLVSLRSEERRVGKE